MKLTSLELSVDCHFCITYASSVYECVFVGMDYVKWRLWNKEVGATDKHHMAVLNLEKENEKIVLHRAINNNKISS